MLEPAVQYILNETQLHHVPLFKSTACSAASELHAWEMIFPEKNHVEIWGVTRSPACLVTKLQSVMLEENRVRSPPTRSYALQAIQASNHAGQAQGHDCSSRSL